MSTSKPIVTLYDRGRVSRATRGSLSGFNHENSFAPFIWRLS
jgi:hypothetical protein